jgi:D-inositol-3-phosphate glycosyltransferase
MLKKAWRVPVVHMFHTLGMMKQRVARTAEEAEGEYRLAGEQKVLVCADRIIAATPAEMAQLQWLYHADTRKISIIPPGVDISHFYPIPKDEAKDFIGVPQCNQMLLYVGRIEPLKGIDTLIEALQLMRKAGVSVCLAVIGGEPQGELPAPNSEMARLHDLRQQYNLEDNIVFLGKRSQDTLPYYYSAAEIVVVPSHYESFGMVALEAMACGTPVVASQVGGLAFLVQDGVTGYTVPVDDPAALADRLTLLMQDPALRRQLGQQAASYAQGYSWEKIAGRMIGLYNSIFETTGRQECMLAKAGFPHRVVQAGAM